MMSCGPDLQGHSDDYWLLNEREKFLVHQLDLDYVHMFQKHPGTDDDLVYFLGDRYEHTRTWSATSRRNPTYRRNSGFYLHRASLRIMTPCDKLASMGWPVTAEAAEAMGTKPLPVMDAERSASLVGNAMHLTQAQSQNQGIDSEAVMRPTSRPPKATTKAPPKAAAKVALVPPGPRPAAARPKAALGAPAPATAPGAMVPFVPPAPAPMSAAAMSLMPTPTITHLS
ncbi:unnamed protein product [Symbiodinium sp. CCMP2592]|nr:unnamed protein product [Symbiodinium sp. CCMP2592]